MNNRTYAIGLSLILSLPALFLPLLVRGIFLRQRSPITEPIELYLIQEVKTRESEYEYEMNPKPKGRGNAPNSPARVHANQIAQSPKGKFQHQPLSQVSQIAQDQVKERSIIAQESSEASQDYTQEVKGNMLGQHGTLQEGAHKASHGEMLNKELGQRDYENYVAEFRRQNYSIIRDMILRKLEYPMVARIRGWEGRTIVVLCLSPESFCGFEIRQSSGYKVLDDAVVRAVNASSREFPLPERRLHLTLPIVFRLTQESQ
ncbi:MAG: TonB family protein [Aquificaceae bacterium]|nr:TonB family protein [Aquificaceae bacterium]